MVALLFCYCVLNFQESQAQVKSFVDSASFNPQTESKVIVNVRVIRATDKMDPGEESFSPDPVKVDRRLKDISFKLQKLPFRAYSLLSSEQKVVPAKKRESFLIASGQSLTVRPLYMEKDEVGLWLKWVDQNGAEILDTRMHINYGESMIAGTDSTPLCGLVLVVDVSPVRQ